jgi:hypothetical protein
VNLKSLMTRCAALALILSAQFSTGAAHALTTFSGTTIVGGVELFNNLNGNSVNFSTTSTAPTIHLAADTFIAEIDTYQKGNVVSTAQLGLKSISTNVTYLFDTFNTVPFPYDVFTYVHGATVDQLFAAGDYLIVNLAADTWASNPGSNFVGFTTVYSRPAPVPEPGTLVLIGASLLGLGMSTRRRKSA